MLRAIGLCCLLCCMHMACAQKILSTGNGVIKFVSTRNGDVSAVNKEVNANISETGDISFKLLVRDFRFAMAEMEEHFNKEYLESDKYPNATFTGRLVGIRKIDLIKKGYYKVQAAGDMTIHNVTKKITVSGTLRIEGNAVTINAKFPINIDDYNIDTGLGGVIIGNKMNVEVLAKCQ
ncbi:MAG TPA: YceI family protein [Chitinophagaceae bacterium]|nr:YceI family protein [Chitinophagaceae bacterium]